ncbi:MAG: 2-dehydropantoate 2-reductase [Oscillospiraceae bacterium]|jgi:2-dehydropantoate 2-reductase|nr:2-dehydropantoate 2-reductase [Oscillospiraceae bacterium]
MKPIRTAALVGMGAIGAFCAPALQKALGDNFSVVAGGERAARIKRGVNINGKLYSFPLISPAEGEPADLVLIAVKRNALEDALGDIKALVGPGTVILSLLNGLDSEEMARAAFPEASVLYSVVYVSSGLRDGAFCFDPALGYIAFGEAGGRSPSRQVEAVRELFDRCGLRYKIREDMILEIWRKLLSNVAQNLPCALIGSPIASVQRSEHMRALSMGSMLEVVAAARAEGVNLTSDDCESVARKTALQAPANAPSTLQDIMAGRKTEVEMLAGSIVRISEKHGLRAPFCEFFCHAINALEEKNEGKFDV